MITLRALAAFCLLIPALALLHLANWLCPKSTVRALPAAKVPVSEPEAWWSGSVDWERRVH